MPSILEPVGRTFCISCPKCVAIIKKQFLLKKNSAVEAIIFPATPGSVTASISSLK
jgi:hypothetical protein